MRWKRSPSASYRFGSWHASARLCIRCFGVNVTDTSCNCTTSWMMQCNNPQLIVQYVDHFTFTATVYPNDDAFRLPNCLRHYGSVGWVRSCGIRDAGHPTVQHPTTFLHIAAQIRTQCLTATSNADGFRQVCYPT